MANGNTPTIPTVHLNGTDGDDLFKQWADAALAVRRALDELPNPHGRDYYPQGNTVLKKALDEISAHREALRETHEYLTTVARGIHTQVARRERQRA